MHSLHVYSATRSFLFFLITVTLGHLHGQTNLGDLDADGQPTVLDVVRLVNHLQGDQFLPASSLPFADVNEDEFVNTDDVEALTDVILERSPFQEFPFLRVSRFSPTDGEKDVAVTRELVMRFSLPIADDAVINTDNFYAAFAGEKLGPSRVIVSDDRLKATLFFDDNLPTSARIRGVFVGDGINDYLGRPIDPDGDGVAGGTAIVDYDTLNITTGTDTAVVGRVLAADVGPGGEEIPLENVLISVIGDEQNTFTTTDADGFFTLENAPVGRFFAFVDGRPATGEITVQATTGSGTNNGGTVDEGATSSESIGGSFPDGDYFAFVAKPWSAVAGRQDNMPTEDGIIYLPLIESETLTSVSATEMTPVSFPESVVNVSDDPNDASYFGFYTREQLEGTEITVPPNALFDNDGIRGGMIGIAPVPGDRLPEPLPTGLNIPVVITVQTNGPRNFDVPVPAKFPNVPDPITGETLPPGAKSALWSFDHDTGRWEIAGPMTVTADGLFVVSDPGTGIRQPGWHGTDPATEGRGGKRVGRTVPRDGDGDDGEDDEDDCRETGGASPYGNPQCTTPGSLVSAGSFESSEITICKDESVAAPAISGTEFTDGEKTETRMDEQVCEDSPPIEPLERMSPVTYSPEYIWQPQDPSTFDFSRGGSYTFTAQVRGKGDPCPDVGPAAVEGQLVVNVVEITDITFSKEDLEPDGMDTATATAQVIPGGTMVEWSLQGDIRGASIDAQSGVITAGTEAGSVTVRATEPESGCFVEASICVGDDCCPDKSGTVRFGPVAVNLPGNVVPLGQDAEGFCEYSTDASIELQLNGVFQRQFGLDGTSVSWKENPDTGAFKEVTISWEGEKELPPFGVVQANITGASLSVDSSGNLSGSLDFQVDQTEDVTVGGIAIFRKGTSGTFSYTYTGANSFLGTFDFGGITNVQIDLEKNGTKIGKISVNAFDSEGNLTGARFEAEPATFETSGFTAEMRELSLEFDFNIADVEVDFMSGTGEVAIKDITNIDGEFVLNLEFSPENITVTVTLEDVKAFNTDINGTIETTFNYSFDLESLTGEDISFKHAEFDQEITGISFEVDNGELIRFAVDAVDIKYNDALEFSFRDGLFDRAEGTLSFDASVKAASIEFEVKEFKIDDAGTVTVTELSASINESPIQASIRIQFFETEFRGDFSGQFASKIGIRGSVIVGASEESGGFNYGFFTLTVTTPGFPIGQSGLQVKTLSGEFGYNWLATSGEAGSTEGEAELGAITVGFGIGISDLGELALLEGSIRVVLGSASSISITGALSVTANTPYFAGQMTVTYELGEERYSGSLDARLTVPAGDGRVVDLGTNEPITYSVANRRFQMDMPSTGGSILRIIDINASANVRGSLANASAINGRLNGTVDASQEFNYAWPEGFDATNCDTASETDTLGFGLSARLTLELDGGLNVAFDRSGIRGSVRVSASADGSATVKLIGFCPETLSASISGTVSIIDTGSSTRINGTVTITVNGDSFSAEIDETFA